MSVRMTVVAVSVWLLSGGNTWAAPFTSLYSFGDSLSDAGDSPSAVTSLYKILGNNCDPTHLCPPYFDGRISNGPVASEQLASKLFPGSVTARIFAAMPSPVPAAGTKTVALTSVARSRCLG